MTPTEQDKELRGIVGEIPNYIFECLELSDEIKEEWKYGSKASDFGSHNQFVQRFSKRIEAFITADRKRVALEARLNGKWEILSKIPDGTSVLEDGKIGSAYELRIKVNREIAELKAQQEEV